MLTTQRSVRQPDRDPKIVGPALAADRCRYLGNNPTNAVDPTGLQAAMPGELPGNPTPNKTIRIKQVAFVHERVVGSGLLGSLLRLLLPPVSETMLPGRLQRSRSMTLP